MKQISHIFSGVFSPLLVPTYAMILAVSLTILSYLPLSAKITVCAATFFITCLMPLAAIFLLLKRKVVSDPGLNQRSERLIPYVITILCYLGCALYLYRASAPGWLTGFMIGGAAAAVVSLVVNFWWKISAHAAALGGLVAMMFRVNYVGVGVHDMLLWTILAVIITGCVGTSRIYLGRHTLWQVTAGAFNGFVCVYLISGLM